MRKLLLLGFLFCLFSVNVDAQTPTELLMGKWKLVKWTTKKGTEKNIVSEFETDQVYQIFNEGGKFISVVGEKENKGKWKLSKENDVLTIRLKMIIVVDFHIDFMDAKKRIITTDQLGTLEYEKVE